jgi:hypothetical protein
MTGALQCGILGLLCECGRAFAWVTVRACVCMARLAKNLRVLNTVPAIASDMVHFQVSG